MKNLLLASITAITIGLSGSVFAGSDKSGEYHHRHMDRLTEKLDLTPEQQEQVREIKKEQMEKHREVHEQSRERMNEVLNDEQRQRFEEFHKENHERMKKMHGERKTMKSE